MIPFRRAEDRIETLAKQVVTGTDLEVMAVKCRSEAKRRFVTVYLDKPAGAIGLDDCQRVSEELSILLDAEADLISGRYFLEVSSPGIFRPLLRPEHYSRFAGEKVKLRTAEPVRGLKRIRGTLLSCDGQIVRLRLDSAGGDEFAIALDNIRDARLDPDLNAGSAKRAEKLDEGIGAT